MGSVRYIGSKTRIVDQIVAILGSPKAGGRFVDVFSGTGAVSRGAAMAGWAVYANDYLRSSAHLTLAQLIERKDASLAELGGYEAAIKLLNACKERPGFIYREYSPSGMSVSGHVRNYFTKENAARIDSIRRKIATWKKKGAISNNEEALLIADLLGAANAVANIAGTYGCFLRRFAPNAIRPLELKVRPLLDAGKSEFEVTAMDAFSLTARSEDVLYLDPPYTKRQYPAYYHVLETIAAGDEPIVGGVTGLRPWKDRSSPFCFKRKAPDAFRKILSRLPTNRALVSYSSDGHISLDDLVKVLGEFGRVKVCEVGTIGRYAPNARARKNSTSVIEYVLELSRELNSGKKESSK